MWGDNRGDRQKEVDAQPITVGPMTQKPVAMTRASAPADPPQAPWHDRDGGHPAEDHESPVLSDPATGPAEVMPAVVSADRGNDVVGRAFDTGGVLGRRVVEIEQKVENNYGTIAGVVENVRRLLDYHDLTDEYVTGCVASYARPPRMVEAEKILKRERVVVIAADVDTGRHDAAVVLLRSMPDITVREVRREPGDRLDVGALDVESSSGWLLDLRGDDRLDHTFGRSLLDQRLRLEAQGSYLAVVVAPLLWASAGVGAQQLVFPLQRASAPDIVRSRLNALEPPINATPYLEDPRIARRLADAMPSEALRWVQAIVHVAATPVESDDVQDGDRLDPAEILPRRITLVIELCGNYRPQLLEWHKKNPDSRVRNFLLTAAVLEGWTAGEVFTASTRVAVALGEDEPDVEGQRGPGILELVDTVGARLVNDEHLSFPRPGYADAVIDYFWVDRQHLQTLFLTWICRLPLTLRAGDPGTAEAVAARIAGYVLRWTTRNGRLKLLREVVWDWALHTPLRTTLVDLLTAAALDLGIGRSVRDELLEWAKEGNRVVPVEVKALTAQVCGGALARIYPKVALYRLAQLAACADPGVVESVEAAINNLWRNTGIRGQLVDQVTAWCDGTDTVRRQAGTRAFLSLAVAHDPITKRPELADLSSGRLRYAQLLTIGWRAVLTDRLDDMLAGDALSVWLDAILRQPQLLPPLEQVLITVVRGVDKRDIDHRRFTRLTVLLFRWQPALAQDTDPRRADLRDRIHQSLIDVRPEVADPATSPAARHDGHEPDTADPGVADAV